jgi:hypothetical protein
MIVFKENVRSVRKYTKKKVCNGGGCINLTIDSLANAIANLNEDCLSPKGFSTHS